MRVAKTFVTNYYFRGCTLKEVMAGSKICQVLEPRPRSHFPCLETCIIPLICLPPIRAVRVTENAATSQNRSLDWTLENVIFLSLTVILENMK